MLGADERILAREIEIFEALRRQVAAEAPRVLETARVLATLDVLAGSRRRRRPRNDYTKPRVHEGDELLVIDGRHPVVERRTRDPFVPNDLALDATTQQLIVLTGPNMGGKSTYLRQAALVCVMAQAGSFVPARQAKLPDRSTACSPAWARRTTSRAASRRSWSRCRRRPASCTPRRRARLVVLDEIGRGTATFDGLSIAWAVAEHLASNSRARPKTLFATHYHELTDLADALPGVANCHVAVREWHDDIVFLRKVLDGRSDRSYGIQVARLAGLPPAVVSRARDILGGLERDELTRGGRPSLQPPAPRRAAAVGALPGRDPARGTSRAPAARGRRQPA